MTKTDRSSGSASRNFESRVFLESIGICLSRNVRGEKTCVSENTQCRNFFQIIPVFLLRVRRRSLEVD